MNNDEEKLRLIKKTVYDSLMLEMESRLNDKVSDLKKRKEILRFVSSNLKEILNSSSANELLPKHRIESEQDFKSHILKIINLSRDKLLIEVEKEMR